VSADAAWPRGWDAQWVWAQPVPPVFPLPAAAARPRPADSIWLLRREIDLPTDVQAARLRITADGRYRLWVNGSRVGDGPVRSAPAHLSYDDYDLASLLVPGPNALAVLVRHYGTAVAWWQPATPLLTLGCGGLLAELAVQSAGGAVRVGTDARWRARPAHVQPGPGTGFIGSPAPEVVDLRRLPHGWDRSGYDDTDWTPVAVLAERMPTQRRATPPDDPFPLLGPSPLPRPTRTERVPARLRGRASVELSDDPAVPVGAVAASRGSELLDLPVPELRLAAGEAVTVDFGRMVSGRVLLRLESEPGAVLDIAAGEELTGDGLPIVEPRRWALRVLGGGTHQEVEALEPVGLRYAQLASRGGSSRVQISVVESLHIRSDSATFACSDTSLTQLWQTGARTLDLCTDDAYLDCPGRERRAWLGDAYLHGLLGAVTGQSPQVMAHGLALHAQAVRSDGLLPGVAAGDLAEAPITLPDYSLHWVRSLARTLAYGGDLELAVPLMPVATGICQAFERWRGSDGLLEEVPGWLFVDWAQTERGGHTAALDLLLVLALRDLAEVADLIGDAGTAQRSRSRADHGLEAAAIRYLDPGRGLLVDAASPGGQRGRRVSQQTTALAVLAGALTGAAAKAALDAVTDPHVLRMTRWPGQAQGTAEEHLGTQQGLPAGFDPEAHVVMAQPFFMHFVHQALVAAGLADRLVESCGRWLPQLDSGNDSLEEYWEAAPGAASRCHAWSATPTYDLTTHVVGLAPAAPGWSEIVLRPALADLAWARAAVTSPYGPVAADVRRDGATVTVSADLPPGVSGTAWLGTAPMPLHPGPNRLTGAL